MFHRPSALLYIGTSGLSALACLSVAAVVGAQPAPVPPPIPQSRTDCAWPQYASDTLICADAELLAVDKALAKLPRPTLAEGAMWEDDTAWIRRRSRCAFEADHRACLAASYADRTAVLVAAVGQDGHDLRCNGAWRGRTLKAGGFAEGMTVAIAGDHALIAVASPKPAVGMQWQPFLTWHWAGKQIVLEGANGDRITCWPAVR